MPSIEQELHSFIAERFCFGRSGSFSDSDSFLQKGILDSTGMVEFVTFIESHYGLALEDGELVPENLDSVACAADFVCQKLAAQRRPQPVRISLVPTVARSEAD